MNRTRRLAAFAVLVSALLAAGLTYWYLYHPAPRPSHDAYLKPDTAIRAVLLPVRIQSYISSLAPAITRFVDRIPRLTSMQAGPIRLDWIHALPIEFTLLFAQKSPAFLEVTLYVKESPESRDFAGVLNDSYFFHDFRAVEWPSPRVHSANNRALVATGSLPIPPAAQEETGNLWPQTVLAKPPPIAGKHFLEIAVNNENGVLMELHAASRQTYGPWGGEEMHAALTKAWPAIRTLHLSADLTGADILSFALAIETGEDAGSSAVDTAADAFLQAAASWLEEKEEFHLSGETRWKDARTFSGSYRLTGFETKLRQALN